MPSSFVTRAAVPITALASLCFMLQPSRSAAQGTAPQHVSALTIPTANLIQPDDLNRLLRSGSPEKPLIFQVGSHMMFAQAHIAGSEYAGPGSQPDGIEQLRGHVSSLPHDRFIVLYCGCCPWNRCPNIGPAYNLLQQMGFTNVKVLYIADNFGADWVSKGYPVESSQ